MPGGKSLGFSRQRARPCWRELRASWEGCAGTYKESAPLRPVQNLHLVTSTHTIQPETLFLRTSPPSNPTQLPQHPEAPRSPTPPCSASPPCGAIQGLQELYTSTLGQLVAGCGCMAPARRGRTTPRGGMRHGMPDAPFHPQHSTAQQAHHWGPLPSLPEVEAGLQDLAWKSSCEIPATPDRPCPTVFAQAPTSYDCPFLAPAINSNHVVHF